MLLSCSVLRKWMHVFVLSDTSQTHPAAQTAHTTELSFPSTTAPKQKLHRFERQSFKENGCY